MIILPLILLIILNGCWSNGQTFSQFKLPLCLKKNIWGVTSRTVTVCFVKCIQSDRCDFVHFDMKNNECRLFSIREDLDNFDCTVFTGLFHKNKKLQFISQNKPTNQSSTIHNYPFVKSFKAVDGDQNSMSHTGLDEHAWWSVDLEDLYEIDLIVIYNRKDQFGDRLSFFSISVADKPEASFFKCGGYPHQALPAQVISLTCDWPGRIVQIQLDGTNYLQLVEVMIFGNQDIRTPLSVDRSTHQSSDFLDSGSPALHAIDRNSLTSPNLGSCAITKIEANPWWEIDLVSVYRLTHIVIHNRPDCCPQELGPFLVQSATDTQNGYVMIASNDKETPAGQVVHLRTVGSGRLVRIVKKDHDHLTLCEVMIFGESDPLQLLSLNKPTSQSSNIADNTISSLAVDGNINNEYYSGSCAHTQQEFSWWRVDLLSQFHITDLFIYNRGDCCSERLAPFLVQVASTADGDFTNCAEFYESSLNHLLIHLQCSAFGQVVQIKKTNSEYLTLCEVMVYGRSDRK